MNILNSKYRILKVRLRLSHTHDCSFIDSLEKEIAECKYCQENRNTMEPSHFASDRCESGKRNHCTCDTCF